jgi:hypothetical protein
MPLCVVVRQFERFDRVSLSPTPLRERSTGHRNGLGSSRNGTVCWRRHRGAVGYGQNKTFAEFCQTEGISL